MKLGTAFLTIGLLIFASGAGAQTKHVIQFGGDVGFAYSPNDINVSVGDTIEWQGEFSMHPLRSADPGLQLFPVAAAPISVDTGTVFQYVVTVTGTHGYYCQFHVLSNNMAGRFVAGGSSVTESKLAGVELFQNVPNPASGSTTISFDLAKPTTLTLHIYTLAGKEVATLADGNFGAGINTIPFNTSALPSGIYMYRLSIDGESITKQLIVTK